MEDKHSKLLGRSFPHPHINGQLQRERGIGSPMADGLLPVALLSTGSKPTEGKLLPPINILSQGCDSSEPSRQALVSSGLQDLYPLLPWRAGNAHGHGHGTGEISKTEISCLERERACSDISCGRRRLRNSSPGPKQQRGRAGRALSVGPGPHSCCAISTSDAGTISTGPPITYLRKPEVPNETFSSEESVEQAVTAPKICRRHAMLTSPSNSQPYPALPDLD